MGRGDETPPIIIQVVCRYRPMFPCFTESRFPTRLEYMAWLRKVKADAVPAEAVPAKAVAGEVVPVPAEAVPAEAVPAEAVPAEAVPAEAVPAEAAPGEAVPAEAMPAEAVPAEAVPAEAVPAEANRMASKRSFEEAHMDALEDYGRAHSLLVQAGSLVFDTETCGLRKSVIELAWVLSDERGEELCSHSELWHPPPDESIDPGAFAVHGISESKLLREGTCAVPGLKQFVRLFGAAVKAGVKIVCHNAAFDVARMNHTLRKHDLNDTLLLKDTFCTMQRTKRRCNLYQANGRLKNPRNDELFEKLYGRKPTGQLHRALDDCRVTLASYTRALELEWF